MGPGRRADSQEYLMFIGSFVAAAGAVLTWLLVELVKRLSLRWQLYDHPNIRSSHTVPTPRLGGVGMAAVLIGALVVFGARSGAGAWWTLAVVGALVSGVSLLDDLRSLPPGLRLGLHFAAAGAVLWQAGPLSTLQAGAIVVPLAWWAGSLCLLLWIAGFINAFNFMDGIDGIAGGQAAVAGMGWVIVGTMGGAPALVDAGWLVFGVSLGFLMHNWSPASIFMGDAGSALLGFVLAAGPVLLGGPQYLAPAALLVWPFLFDTAFTLVRRARRGEPVWQAHRSHLYQRLAGPGVSHRSVALLYAALSLLGALAVALMMVLPGGALIALALVSLGALTLWRLVERREGRAPVSSA